MDFTPASAQASVQGVGVLEEAERVDLREDHGGELLAEARGGGGDAGGGQAAGGVLGREVCQSPWCRRRACARTSRSVGSRLPATSTVLASASAALRTAHTAASKSALARS
jgi:hypothetical protein